MFRGGVSCLSGRHCRAKPTPPAGAKYPYTRTNGASTTTSITKLPFPSLDPPFSLARPAKLPRSPICPSPSFLNGPSTCPARMSWMSRHPRAVHIRNLGPRSRPCCPTPPLSSRPHTLLDAIPSVKILRIAGFTATSGHGLAQEPFGRSLLCKQQHARR